jgi:epoxyqueuosine reductase
MLEKITARLNKRGYRLKVIPYYRLAEMKLAIEEQHHRGDFQGIFYEERLSRFNPEKPEQYPEARSLIITAAPQPQQIIEFEYAGKTHSVLLPPTYSGDTDSDIESILKSNLEEGGYRLYLAPVVPYKLAAVRSGLASYGRNNIAYIDGMGSFFRLRVFASDLPSGEDEWHELSFMDTCNNCTACIKKCPTGAITGDRFLIKADRCICAFNESEKDFPDWLCPEWHHCLLGCMYCQLSCPVDKKFYRWFETAVSFNREETKEILNAELKKDLGAETAAKLDRVYLLEDIKLISRNLKVLLDRS